MASAEQNPFAEQTEVIDDTRSTLCNHWAQLLQRTLFTGVSTQLWCWGRKGCSPLQRQAGTSERAPAVPGEEWGHRQCVLAWPGAFAQGGEAQAQESQTLPSCLCSPWGQSLGSPPSADLQLRQELSRSSRARCSGPRSRIKL